MSERLALAVPPLSSRRTSLTAFTQFPDRSHPRRLPNLSPRPSKRQRARAGAYDGNKLRTSAGVLDRKQSELQLGLEPHPAMDPGRSEELRVGNEWSSTCRSR